ncbi:unnamed protein product [Phaedon cochleariae]|uniref:Uncharacterized protein n=1 Tax=Phaedon cochleariae TaxID=80249 RepID=A0A9P0DP65_PHACE|nr:unnamed protein product [Phaedon cochleariae]
MSKEEILKQYRNDVVNIIKSAKELSLNDEEIKLLFKESFSELKNEINRSKAIHNPTKAQNSCSTFRNTVLLCIILFLAIYVLLNVHQPTSSIVLRNVQGLTHPTLKIVRFLSVPIIKLFPSLTDLYDESCLVENPYFYVSDMECWPCENINSVLNITKVEENLIKSGSGTPFIIKTNQSLVTFHTLQKVYNNNKKILDAEAKSFKSTNTSIITLKDLFSNSINFISSNIHISWRINKMAPARVIRQVFPKPEFLPERSGQSVERFVFIDGDKSEPYTLPNTECSNVFVVQGKGQRSIVLKPSKECAGKCRTVSVVLKASYVLWYNWWYWRPVSLPTQKSSGPSITYINSYC